MNETKPDWLTPEVQAHICEIAYDFPVRAFGEEMARINFLPPEEHMKEIYDMIDHAVAHGVSFKKPALGVTP
jgi:hypothetical protein